MTTIRPLRCLSLLAAFLTISTSLHAEAPVKAYILVGQSNMQGKGAVEGDGDNSLRYAVENDAKKEYQFLVNDKGEWVKRDDVWIFYDQAPSKPRFGGLEPGYGTSGGQIGPELGFGILVGEATDEKVLLIKASWGGKSLGNDFLPPSVGKYPKPLVPGDPGYFYHEVLRIVEEATRNIDTYFPDYKGQGIELAGFGWHQGWNDQYNGLEEKYEANLVALIQDIRSAEHGLGVPELPFVIATSGMIAGEHPIKTAQLAVADTDKYPAFAGNVAVVDTDKPYGPEKWVFKHYTEKSPDKVGYHWNNHALSYLNIGRAMGSEILKLNGGELPSRMLATGTEQGVRLNWQLGTATPESARLLRNGDSVDAKLEPTQTEFIDTTALPGANRYELVLRMPSGEHTLNATCDTSPTGLRAYRGLEGVMLTWQADGKYEGFRVTRDGKTIADKLPGDARSFSDKEAPSKGKATYTVAPLAGKVTPSSYAINLGPSDPRGAVLYEPFDYPAKAGEPQLLEGKGGALGTKGTYTYLGERNPERGPATIAESFEYGGLPVTGNRGSTHRWSEGGYIELDDSLSKAGLLEDGATMWMSYLFQVGDEFEHRKGGGAFSLRSGDMKEGIGFKGGGQYETLVIMDGKELTRRITGTQPNKAVLVVARVTWGKDGEEDSFVPFHVGPDLKLLDEKEGRHSVPFNIDQTKLSRLVLHSEGQFDEIRVGPTFESVTGAGK